MAWTQSELDALQAVIGTGVLSVRYADRTVVYQSMEDMKKTLSDMKRDVAASAGTATPYRLVSTNKGFY